MEFASDHRRLLAAQTKRLARDWCMSGIESRVTPDTCLLLVSSATETTAVHGAGYGVTQSRDYTTHPRVRAR